MALRATNQTQEARLQEILTGVLNRGKERAMAAIQRVERDVLTDAIVRAPAVTFVPHQAVDVERESPRVQVKLGNQDALEVHPHALGQLADRVKIPTGYLSKLAAGGGWMTELAAHVLGETYHNQGTRYLARFADGMLRGWLSDRFRRIDCRPCLETSLQELAAAGALIVDGLATDIRVTIKALVPRIWEIAPGELVLLGLEWSNSDVAAARNALRFYVLRPSCYNGAVMEDLVSMVHLGGQIPDNITLADDTLAASTRAAQLTLRDGIRTFLEPEKLETMVSVLRRANETGVEWRNVSARISKRVLKPELDAARAAWESADVTLLPAGQTVWRAANALMLVANQVTDQDRRAELERVSGLLISGKEDTVQAES